MRVSASPYVSTSYERPSVKPKTQPVQDSYSSVQAKATKAQEGNDSSAVWDELSQKYDIRNATSDEFSDIASQLYEAGQISASEYSSMTFDPSKSPVKKNIFLTPTNQDGKRDWIAEFEKRAELQLRFGDKLGYSNSNNIIEILKRLQ